MKVAWRKVKIGDVCETSLGKMLDTKKNKGKMHCYLNNVAVRWGTFDLSNLPEMCFTQDDKNRYTIKRGDVVICEGGEPGRCAIWKSDEPIFFQKALHRIRMKEGLFNEYFYYSFRHLVMSGATRKYETGSTIRHLSRQSLNQIDIHIPPQEVQRKIAKILSSIDDKIEVNTKINHNLEEQANILIEQYCSHRKSLKLGDIISFVNGYAFKSSSYVTKGAFKVITIKNVQDGKIETSGADCVSEIPENMKNECALQIGDILLSLTGNVGRTGIVCEENLLLNQRVAKIVPYKRELLPTIYFIFRRAATRKSLETISRGTAQLNLSPVETLNVKIPLCIESLVNMAPFLNSFFEQIVSNEQECQRLIKLRDTLLPKLMSGEIDVSEVEV